MVYPIHPPAQTKFLLPTGTPTEEAINLQQTIYLPQCKLYRKPERVNLQYLYIKVPNWTWSFKFT